MAQRCRVCSHTKLAEIDAALKGSAESVSQLARDHNMTRYALMRHRDRHLGIKREPEKIKYRPGKVIPRRKLWNSPVRRAGDPQQRFLDAYVEFGNVSTAADVASVSKKTIYQWQEHDEQFMLKMHDAEQQALAALEAEARQRATKGSQMVREVWRGDRLIERVVEFRPSDTLLIKLLQALAPEKYGDKLAVTQTSIVKTVEQNLWEAV